MRWLALPAALMLVLSPALSGCLESGDGDGAPSGELTLRTVAKGSNSGIETRREAQITSNDQWQDWWRMHDTTGAAAPEVDFSKEHLLALVIGNRPNACYAVEIQRAVADETANVLIAEARVTVPEPDAACPEVVTQPFHVVAVPASPYTVAWKVTEPREQKPAGEVEWATVAEGTQSGIQANTTLVASKDAAWAELWSRHTENQEPAPDRPEVDFATHRVVAYFAGEKPDGCHGVTATGANRTTDGYLVVDVQHRVPGPDMGCADVVTYPFVMVTIPAGDEPVRVRQSVRQAEAGAGDGASQASGEGQAGAVDWAVLEEGAHSRIREERTTLAATEAEWTALWDAHTEGDPDAPPRPGVDFVQHRVFAVFMGERANGCYAAEATGAARDREGHIVVNVTYHVPAPDAYCSSVMTSPFVMVTVPAGDVPVRAEIRTSGG